MNKVSSLGVIIGRFQIHELHVGHRHLIEHVLSLHERVLILIGHNDIRPTPRDPLPYRLRAQMIKQAYPNVAVAALPDSKIDNKHWSLTVDELIAKHSNSDGAVLYGSRNSFIPQYTGQSTTFEVSELPGVNATAERERIAESVLHSSEFRQGWIQAIATQFPVTDPTVDIAIVTPDWEQVLLGRRGLGAPLRFIGGFVDFSDASLEAAAKRERSEEVKGITVGAPQYLGSFRIDDIRYRHSPYGVMTTFFAMEYQSGTAVAGDDMSVVEWAPLRLATRELLTKSHHLLFDRLLSARAQRVVQI